MVETQYIFITKTMVSDMKISVVPQGEGALGGVLLEETEEYDPLQPAGVDRQFYVALAEEARAEGHDIGTVDQIAVEEADLVLFIGLRSGIEHYLRAVSGTTRPLLAYIAREPPSYATPHTEKGLIKLRRCFDRVYTWNTNLTDLSRIEGYHWPIPDSHLRGYEFERSPKFEDRTLLTNVSSRTSSTHPEELYSEREAVIEYYDQNHPEDFTLYGKGWNDGPTVADVCTGRWDQPTYDVYEGMIDDKLAGYRSHKFALAFENMTGIRGFLSEKIFDAFAAERVPVYWGTSYVTDRVPSETFIDYREFGSPAALHEHLDDMDESEYRSYLDAIESFLNGPANKFAATEVASNMFDSLSSLMSEGKMNEVDPAYVQKLNQTGVYDTVTYSAAVKETVAAMVDPPRDVSRGDVVRSLTTVARSHFL